MQPFEILIDVNGTDHPLLVVPFPNEIRYNIFNGLDHLCTVWPLVDGDQVLWQTDENVQIELLDMIGNGIEKSIDEQLNRD